MWGGWSEVKKQKSGRKEKQRSGDVDEIGSMK